MLIPSQAPPSFTTTPESLMAAAEKLISRTRSVMDKIVVAHGIKEDSGGIMEFIESRMGCLFQKHRMERRVYEIIVS